MSSRKDKVKALSPMMVRIIMIEVKMDPVLHISLSEENLIAC